MRTLDQSQLQCQLADSALYTGLAKPTFVIERHSPKRISSLKYPYQTHHAATKKAATLAAIYDMSRQTTSAIMLMS